MRTWLRNLLRDSRVSEVSDESYNYSEAEGAGDGFWVYLKKGWESGDDPAQSVHCVHEWKREDVLAAMRRIKPCSRPCCVNGGSNV